MLNYVSGLFGILYWVAVTDMLNPDQQGGTDSKETFNC